MGTMQKLIENNFKYYAPNENQILKYNMIRDKGKEFALLLNDLCPDSEELILAIQLIGQVVMNANSAIARNEK